MSRHRGLSRAYAIATVLLAQGLAPLAVAAGAPAAAEHRHRSRVGAGQALEHFHGGGLAGPVGPEQAKSLTAPDLEVEAGHGGHVGIPLDQAREQTAAGASGPLFSELAFASFNA